MRVTVTGAGTPRLWRDALAAAEALTVREAILLRLLSRLPLAPVGVLCHFCGAASASSTYRAAARLEATGLAAALRPPQWPQSKGRAPRLLYLVDLGLAVAVVLGEAPHQPNRVQGMDADDSGLAGADNADGVLATLVRERRLSAVGLLARVPGAGRLTAEYRVLAALAAEHPGAPILHRFEPRWRPRYFSRNGRRAVASLPPRARLAWRLRGATVGERCYVILPDLDAAPVAAYRRVLGELYAVRAGDPSARADFPTVVIATRAGGRLDGWHELLRELDTLRGFVLPRRLFTWDTLNGGAPAAPAQSTGGPAGPAGRWCSQGRRSGPEIARLEALADWRADQLDRPLPATATVTLGTLGSGRPAGTGPAPHPPLPRRAALGRVVLDLAPADYRLLDLVGRHPFLSIDELAVLLDVSLEWARRRRDRLVGLGLVRVLQPGEAEAHLVADDLTELTVDGLGVVSAACGLTLDAAVQHIGLVGGGPDVRSDSRLARLRAELLARAEHNRGADGVFIRLAQTARRLTRAGGGGADDALRAWRNPLACRLAPRLPDGNCGWKRLSPLRPDGYGEYRRGGACYGFFVEFDRGTENRDDYLRKFGAYYEYRDSRRYRLHYHGFPQLLFITTDTHVERRIASCAREATAGRVVPLPLLLTARWRYEGRRGYVPPPDGLLGPIWRTADDEVRRRWLP